MWIECKTAIAEFGAEIVCRPEPIKVFEIFTNHYRDEIEDQKERVHFITLVYACKFKDETMLLEHQKAEYDSKPGYLKWFSELPGDLLDVQECYRESWTEISKKLCEMHKEEYKLTYKSNDYLNIRRLISILREES